MKNILAENMLRFGSKNLSVASTKKLQRLAEAAAMPTRDNISMLVDEVLTPAMSNVVPIVSADQNQTDMITFPRSSNTSAATNAMYSGQGVIMYLDKGYYLVCGNIGVIPANGTAITGTPERKIQLMIITPSFTRGKDGTQQNLVTGEGKPVIMSLDITTKPGLNDPKTLVKLCTTIYGGVDGTSFTQILLPKLIKFESSARTYGFTLPAKDIEGLSTIINQNRP